MLHGHGDDAYRYQHKIIADFSTNVWAAGEPVGLKKHLFEQWHLIQKYPEVVAESLAEQVARHHQVKPEEVLVTNGTTESIYLLAQGFRAQRTTIAIPAFAEYEDACRMHQHDLYFLPWEALTPIPLLRSDLFFLCNPNNPTGSIFPDLEALLTKNPQTLFVVDEAFIHFTLSLETAIPLLGRYGNLLILRSMTKAFAIPGLRLGYLVGNKKLIDQLKAFKPPWSVNALAIAAGKYIFDHLDQLQVPVRQLLRDKEALASRMQHLAGIKVHPSHTHFFIAETPGGTAAQLKQYLVEQFGLLIRDAANFRGLGSKHFRVAPVGQAQDQLLITALTEWKNHCS
jgi:threonine-phosphate decarboxylase